MRGKIAFALVLIMLGFAFLNRKNVEPNRFSTHTHEEPSGIPAIPAWSLDDLAPANNPEVSQAQGKGLFGLPAKIIGIKTEYVVLGLVIGLLFFRRRRG